MSSPVNAGIVRALRTQRVQLARVRPLHLESARSYLRRLAEANHTDYSYLQGLTDRRRTAARLHGIERPHEMAVFIEELGGPGLRHWLRAWALSQPPGSLNVERISLTMPFQRQRDARLICSFCASGSGATAYDHSNFSVCLKHGRWTHPDGSSARQCQVTDEQVWRKVEMRYRDVIRSPRISRDVVEDVWALVRDNTVMLGVTDWNARVDSAMQRTGACLGVDDRMALYPETVRVLEVFADESLWTDIPVRWRESDEFRARLRQRMAWIPGDDWVLVEGLSEIMKQQRKRPRTA